MTAVLVMGTDDGMPGNGTNGVNVYDVVTDTKVCSVLPEQDTGQLWAAPLPHVQYCDAVAVTPERSAASAVDASCMLVRSEDPLTLLAPYIAPTSAALVSAMSAKKTRAKSIAPRRINNKTGSMSPSSMNAEPVSALRDVCLPLASEG